jgi:hypothetical protein
MEPTTMNPDILINDFERTENSDALHAILGRALIVATRFDALCKAAALQVEFWKDAPILADDESRSILLTKIAEKHRSLNSSINTLEIPKDISVLLYDANVARNAVAHDLAKGLTGCLDTRMDEASFIQEVSELIFDLAYGDVVISHTIGVLNGETPPKSELLSSYVERVTRWVVER